MAAGFSEEDLVFPVAPGTPGLQGSARFRGGQRGPSGTHGRTPVQADPAARPPPAALPTALPRGARAAGPGTAGHSEAHQGPRLRPTRPPAPAHQGRVDRTFPAVLTAAQRGRRRDTRWDGGPAQPRTEGDEGDHSTRPPLVLTVGTRG